MTKDEALRLALEALKQIDEAMPFPVAKLAQKVIKEALAQPEHEPVAYSYTSRITGAQGFSHHPMPRFIDSESWDIKPLYTQQFTYIPSPKQKVVGWKLVPIEPTNEMLKAMDECSTEGYDERLLAGHASSVYMAAVDVAPTPPQRTWVGLTDKDWNRSKHNYDFQKGVDWAESILKEKNA
tara:strand:- start:331 stop:873 length:543 start_codon:yes stop_codon:yes gene_type:complete